MPGLVESIPSGSRLPQKDVAPTTNQPDDNVQSKKTKTLSPFEMLANAITSKLYSKGHLDVRVESMDVRIPYPSFLKSKDWTSVIASLRGSVLKLVPDDGKGHPEHFVIIGSSIEPIILEQDSNRAALRLKITTPYEILSIVISCDSFQKRKQWMTAFFWSTWERTRLDEVHTANILKNVVCVKDSVDAETVGRAPTTLGDDGRLEGYVSAQVGNQMPDCGKMWMTVGETTSPRSSKIFARSPKTTSSSPTSPSSPIMPSGPAIRLYSSHKGKGRKSPLITVAHITQAYIGFDRWGQSKSKRGWIMIHGTVTLAVQGTEEKPDGYFGFGASPDSQEGWIAIEPDESRTGSVHNVLDWLIAIHDSYGLYGRPDSWSWNKSNPNSLVFGLPTKAQLQASSIVNSQRTLIQATIQSLRSSASSSSNL
ncbi:hypothetical protein DL96DRAFT_424378 [Flagelloscypha sp. PMI_526]|nr:hypothetical protein DL96DRAFT_424378 [Flagelloscypha sp. PMI_526]